MSFERLASLARDHGPRRLVVVGAHERNVLEAVARAEAEGTVEAVLIGMLPEIEKLAAEHGVDLSGHRVEHAETAEGAALRAMELVRAGEVDALMKGKIPTAVLMSVGLKHGLRRSGKLLTHLSAFEQESTGRFLLMSDAGLLPYPTLEQRVQIIKNAVDAARNFGVDQPRVACLSSSEEVDPRIPCSVDAVKLTEMNRPGGELAGHGHVMGPMDLGSAIDPASAALKGIEGAVAGRSDVLHCPDVVAGNLIGKALIYFAGPIYVAGAVVGGAVPIVLLSRASPATHKYYSVLLALACA